MGALHRQQIPVHNLSAALTWGGRRHCNPKVFTTADLPWQVPKWEINFETDYMYEVCSVEIDSSQEVWAGARPLLAVRGALGLATRERALTTELVIWCPFSRDRCTRRDSPLVPALR